ncbi:hypothetical protein Q6670_004080 [Salmonella enterica]|nr:hypothetical protein [Salmonella enterica]
MATTSSNGKQLYDFIFKLVGGAVILFGIYGIVVDYNQQKWGWLFFDVGSCGLLAFARGVGYFFGY